MTDVPMRPVDPERLQSRFLQLPEHLRARANVPANIDPTLEPLKLVMAVSGDGFVSRGPDDDMSWSGGDDKLVFRLLTGVGGILGAGSTTWRGLPRLNGRWVIRLTQTPEILGYDMTLGAFARCFPGAWLIGGQTIALSALVLGHVGEVHLVRSPARLKAGQADEITPWLMSRGEVQDRGRSWVREMTNVVGDVKHEVWRLAGKTL